MKQHHDRARIEGLLAKRAEQGLTFREVSERSGIPVPTLSYYAGKLGLRKQRGPAELVQVERKRRVKPTCTPAFGAGRGVGAWLLAYSPVSGACRADSEGPSFRGAKLFG